MKYLYILIFITCFLQISCSKNSDTERTLDYSTLPELRIDIDLEIEESSDFLPGQLHEMFLAEDESFIVSDMGNMAIVQFESDGSYKREIAQQGQGPGELKTFFSLLDSKRDTLLVPFFGVPVQMDVYIWDAAEHTYFYDYSFVENLSEDKTIDVIETAPESGYFAKIRELSPVIREELFNPPTYEIELVSVVNANYDIQTDSIHVLHKPNSIFVEAEGEGVTPLGAPPFLNEDHIKYMTNNQYMLAKPRDGIIQIYDNNHQILDEIVLNVQERTVSEADLNNEIKHLPERFQGTLRERAPDSKPPFIDVWASEDYFLMHTVNHEQGKEMVLLSDTGQPLGKFSLSEYDEIYDLRQQKIYTLHKNPETGHSVRVYTFVSEEQP